MPCPSSDFRQHMNSHLLHAICNLLNGYRLTREGVAIPVSLSVCACPISWPIPLVQGYLNSKDCGAMRVNA